MSHENSAGTKDVVHVCRRSDAFGYCGCNDVSSAVMEKLREELSGVGFPGFTREEIKRFIPSSLICGTCGHRGILTQDARDHSDLAICARCGHWAFISQFCVPDTQV